MSNITRIDNVITTDMLAKLLLLCDRYLRLYKNISFDELLEIGANPNVIITYLYSIDEIYEFLTNNHIEYAFEDVIENYCNKKIISISDETIRLSSIRPYALGEEYRITEERLDKVFRALEHNMELFDNMYRDKIWIIDSSLGRSEKISISPTRFFHLMGLDEKDFKDESSMKIFESVFSLRDNIKSLMTDRKDLFQVLEKMLERENSIKEAILDGTLRTVINPMKLEMKNYAFERIGLIEHSSGMIFYDKEKAKMLGNYTRLQTDLILLSNFIRKYDLDFIFSTYRRYKYTKNAKDAESLFIPQKGYKQSEFLNGQLASISESARSYRKDDFDFSIRLENDEEPPIEPDDYVVFSNQDKRRIAVELIEQFPNLDTDHLKTFLESNDSRNKDYNNQSKNY